MKYLTVLVTLHLTYFFTDNLFGTPAIQCLSIVISTQMPLEIIFVPFYFQSFVDCDLICFYVLVVITQIATLRWADVGLRIVGPS